MEILDWNRTQYGIKWAWLVVDREVGGKGWSARMEPKAIIIYFMMAVSVGAIKLLAAWKWGKRSPVTMEGKTNIGTQAKG